MSLWWLNHQPTGLTWYIRFFLEYCKIPKMSSLAYIFQIFFFVSLLYTVGRGIFRKGMVDRGLWNYGKGAHISRPIHNGDLLLLCADVNLPVFNQEKILIRVVLLLSLYTTFKEVYFLGIFGVLRYIYNFTQLLFWNFNRQLSQKTLPLKDIQYITGNFNTGFFRTHK